jgi:hypothetical protein
MTTALRPDRKEKVAKTLIERPGKDFKVFASSESLGFDLPQRAGRALWLPMLAMGLMAFPIGIIISIFLADEIANDGNVATIAAQRHLVPAFMFLGFTAVFSAIAFAIARIIGTFRNGGGEVQQTVGGQVQTLRRPWTGWVFLGGMMMAMMVLLAGVVLHFIAAGLIQGDEARAMARSEQWFAWFEGIRRAGIVMYLTSIAFGLATIIHVLRFQSVRVRELASEGGAAGGTTAESSAATEATTASDQT